MERECYSYNLKSFYHYSFSTIKLFGLNSHCHAIIQGMIENRIKSWTVLKGRGLGLKP